MALPVRTTEDPRARARVYAADAALLGVTLIWGVTFSVVKSALRDASPLAFNAVRLSVAALLLLLLYRPRRFPLATWASGALLGLCLAAGYALQTAGLALTSPSNSAFITSLSVILVPLLLALLWRRALAPGVWLGTGMALLGLFLLTSPAGSAAASHRGDLLTLACALAFAFHIIALGELAPRFPFRDLAVLQIGFAAVFTWLALPLVEAPRWHNSSALWIAIGLTAVLATAVAFTVQAWAQQFTPATHTAVVFAFEPVFAWMAATLVWHERLRPAQLAGAALIFAAIFAVEQARAS